MTHCKRFLECKVRLDRNPESPYYKGQGQYYPSDCKYCNSYEEDVKSVEPKVIVNRISLDEYNQLKGTVQYLKQKLQTILPDKKRKSKYD